jgi:hypothetical protein
MKGIGKNLYCVINEEDKEILEFSNYKKSKEIPKQITSILFQTILLFEDGKFQRTSNLFEKEIIYEKIKFIQIESNFKYSFGLSKNHEIYFWENLEEISPLKIEFEKVDKFSLEDSKLIFISCNISILNLYSWFCFYLFNKHKFNIKS